MHTDRCANDVSFTTRSCFALASGISAATPRWAFQLRIPDAMVEPYPVNAVPAAIGIAIAQLDSPLRRMPHPHEIKGPLHGIPLQCHALGSPLAVDSDIECDWVMQNPARGHAGNDRCNAPGRRGSRNDHLHRIPNDREGTRCRNCRLADQWRKKKGDGAHAPPPLSPTKSSY
jgi:hypothetical protein